MSLHWPQLDTLRWQRPDNADGHQYPDEDHANREQHDCSTVRWEPLVSHGVDEQESDES